MSKKVKKQFKTEVQQLLNLFVNSVYSNKEIFLRELISNSSDAIDKLRFKAQTEPAILGNDTEFKIQIIADADKKTITIKDNGIGMTFDEVEKNIGTIAQSGTGEFLKALEKSKSNSSLSPDFIGQFGVGFYSTFMVADNVILITKSIDSDKAVKWESSGDGSYTLEDTEKETRGTSITLHLKPVEKEEQDFTKEFVIREIVKQHSDFVPYPVVMDVEKQEPLPETEQMVDKDGKPIGDTTKTVIKEETLNSMKAIWLKDKKDVTEEEYNEFYKHLSYDWNPPLTKLHMKLEGVTEYSALLYIPSKAPFDLFMRERKHGVSLYCKRVFIIGDCKELIPEYFRFIKGVVDAPDLNLNLSREILQQDALVRNIKKNIVKKVLSLLSDMEKDAYEKFYEEFGQVIKEGLHTDFENKDKLADLARYKTTKSEGKYVSLKEYVANMKPDQKNIFYMTGDNFASLVNSPHLETLKDKDYEVLLMTDPIDEFAVQSLVEYDGKKLKSAEKGDLDIDKPDDKKKENHEEYKDLFEFLKNALDSKVKDVKPSLRMKDSIACLSANDYDMSAYMEKILKESGQGAPNTKRVLELNMEHPVMGKINSLFGKDKNDTKLKEYSFLLYDLAVIGEGGKIENPSLFSKQIGELLNSVLA